MSDKNLSPYMNAFNAQMQTLAQENYKSYENAAISAPYENQLAVQQRQMITQQSWLDYERYCELARIEREKVERRTWRSKFQIVRQFIMDLSA